MRFNLFRHERVLEEFNQLTRTKLIKQKAVAIYFTRQIPNILSFLAQVHGQQGHGCRPGQRQHRNPLGDLEKAYLIDDYAEGKDTGIVDLLLVGKIDQYHLNDLSRKTERYINRKIRSLVLTKEEFGEFMPRLEEKPRLLIWEAKDEKSVP